MQRLRWWHPSTRWQESRVGSNSQTPTSIETRALKTRLTSVCKGKQWTILFVCNNSVNFVRSQVQHPLVLGVLRFGSHNWWPFFRLVLHCWLVLSCTTTPDRGKRRNRNGIKIMNVAVWITGMSGMVSLEYVAELAVMWNYRWLSQTWESYNFGLI